MNISSRQLQHPRFVARLTEILEDSGLPASSLVLEITESLLMQDDQRTLVVLAELAGLGVRLALDDFGTGYAALGYLARFPLHILKVDKSFIDGLPGDDELGTITRAIIGLGRALGMEVAAEGIEDAAQLAFVVAEGCHYAQGYWLDRPQPRAALQRLFDQGDACPGTWCLPLHQGLELSRVCP